MCRSRTGKGTLGFSLFRRLDLVNVCLGSSNSGLGLSPLFVWQSEQSTGLTRLLPLALRLLTLLETQVRRGLEQTKDPVAGLYEGTPTRTTERPTGTRILRVLARAQFPWTHMRMGRRTFWHLTPLSPLHEQLLRHVHLPTSLYTALAYNAS